jgi:LacI family transcriptional regulator
MRKSVNYRDIAKAAGVSLGTVSLALRSHSSIPKQTRERVQQVAQQLGYRPNPRVAELMSEIRRSRRVDSLTETVALIWTDATREQVRNYEHLLELEEAARTRLARQGFGLDIFYYDAQKLAGTERILRARGIRGIILAPLINLRVRQLDWEWSHFSVVIVGSGLWQPEFNRIRFNHFEEMGLILHHLRDQQVEKVGLITEKEVDMRTQCSVTGGFLAHRRESTRDSIFESNGENREQLLEWIQRTKPDCIIIASSMAMYWLLESQIDCRIVLTSQHLHPEWPRFGCILEDYTRLVTVAAEQLIAQLALNQSGPPEHPIKILIAGSWQAAASESAAP